MADEVVKYMDESDPSWRQALRDEVVKYKNNPRWSSSDLRIYDPIRSYGSYDYGLSAVTEKISSGWK